MAMLSDQLETEQTSINEYAFFDVDDTLIADISMFSFQNFWLEKHGDAASRALFEKEIVEQMKKNTSRNDLNRRYYAQFSGREVKRVEKCAREWFEFIQLKVKNFFHKNSVAELQWHQSNNREVVFVSGSFHALLEPIAQRLGVRHILAIKMEEENGLYTGNILPPQTIGEGKAKAVKDFLAERMGDKRNCYAYGDDISDLPMLNVVGHPCVVRGGRELKLYAQKRGSRELELHAQKNGWKIISPV